MRRNESSRALHLRSASKAESDAHHWEREAAAATTDVVRCEDWRTLSGHQRRVSECHRKAQEARVAAARHRQLADVAEVSERHTTMACCEE